MKHIKIILISVAVVLLLVACSNLIGSSKTSLVTITIGSDKVASIDIQRATAWAKLKNFLAENVHVPIASAAAVVPGNVLSISLSVTAPDMPAISQVVDVAGSSVTIIVEVPNGPSREFAVTGFDGLGGTGNRTYWSGTTIDLSGNPVLLSLQMINLGSVNGFLFVSTSGSDASLTGDEQNPFRTITHALAVATLANGHVAILVGPGTYDAADPINPETFPFQLPTNTALVCLGANNSTVIASNLDGIYGGNTLNSVQFCTLRVCDSIGISDSTLAGGPPSPMLINHVLFPDDPISCGGGPGDAIILGADSTVIDTVIQDPFTSGITINGGNPVIKNTTITGGPLVTSFTGILVAAAAGNPTITNSTITKFVGSDGNGVGISVAANALITGNTLSGNYFGIYVSAGSPSISNNNFTGNLGNGINIADGSPTINNNTVTNNGSGIESTSGSPTLSPLITNNVISGGFYGIFAYSGTWAISGNTISGNTSFGIQFYALSNVGGAITGNTIISNGTGIDLTGGGTFTFPSINNNSLSCNTTADLSTLATTTTDVTNNSWDHAPPTAVFTACTAGTDICYSGTAPTFTPFNPTVPSPCP